MVQPQGSTFWQQDNLTSPTIFPASLTTMQTSDSKSPILPHQSEPERSAVVQLTGAKLSKERKRTIELAQGLPRGVKIGHRKDGRPKPYFVRFGHPRKTESFVTERERNDRAADLKTAREEHGAQVMRFDPKEWAEFKTWKESKARQRVGLLTKDAIEEYLKLRAAEGLAGDSIRHTRTNLRRFAEMLGNTSLADIAPAHVREWLAHLEEKKLGPASRRHHRKDLNVFFNRAIREEWRTGVNPCTTVVPPKVTQTEEVAVMALKEAFQFFKANRDQRSVGRLAAEAFAGLRHSSAARLELADLQFAECGLVLPGSKHKSGRRHYVDGYPRNLWRWLKHAPADCWTLTGRNYGAHKAMAFARAGLENPGNVFRHTFTTMHLAAFKDAPALGTLLTHRNLTMLYAHYKGRGVSQAVARAFFMITPRTVLLSFERFCRFAHVPQPVPQ